MQPVGPVLAAIEQGIRGHHPISADVADEASYLLEHFNRDPRRRIDLALLRSEELLSAKLPATELGFQFDAFLEFKYLSDYWTLPKAQVFGGDPIRGRESVQADVEKIRRHLQTGACRLGYVIVFAECDYGFEDAFVAEAEAKTGCRLRFIRGYS